MDWKEQLHQRHPLGNQHNWNLRRWETYFGLTSSIRKKGQRCLWSLLRQDEPGAFGIHRRCNQNDTIFLAQVMHCEHLSCWWFYSKANSTFHQQNVHYWVLEQWCLWILSQTNQSPPFFSRIRHNLPHFRIEANHSRMISFPLVVWTFSLNYRIFMLSRYIHISSIFWETTNQQPSCFVR